MEMSRSAIGILAASCLAVGAGATYLVNVQAPGTQALTPTVDASSTPAPSTQTAANGTGAGASTAAPAVTTPAASLRQIGRAHV